MDDKSIICNFEDLYNAYKRAKAGKTSWSAEDNRLYTST